MKVYTVKRMATENFTILNYVYVGAIEEEIVFQ